MGRDGKLLEIYIYTKGGKSNRNKPKERWDKDRRNMPIEKTNSRGE